MARRLAVSQFLIVAKIEHADRRQSVIHIIENGLTVDIKGANGIWRIGILHGMSLRQA